MALTPLTCSNCTAPLPDDDDGDGLLRCGYCGRTHRFVRPPPAPAVHQHPKGALVVVEWNRRWWDASVLEVVGPDRWKIHYDGWGSRWDEVVGPERIRDRAAADASGLPRVRGSGRPAVAVAVIVLGIALAIGVALFAAVIGARGGAPSGQPITRDTPLSAGQAVAVEWHGSWYDAHVVRTYEDGRVRVDYDAYGPEWDEDVERDRIRVGR